MFNWRMLLAMLMPMLNAVGLAKVNEDTNDTGKDDIIGQAILFGVKIFQAILGGNTDALKQMIPAQQLVSPNASHFQDPAQIDGSKKNGV